MRGEKIRVVFHRETKIRKIRDFEIRDFFSHSKKIAKRDSTKFEALRISYFSFLRDLVFEISYFSYFLFTMEYGPKFTFSVFGTGTIGTLDPSFILNSNIFENCCDFRRGK